MNNEMPDDVWVDNSVMVCWPDGEQPKNADITRYTRADKAAPVERIGELDELREALAQYGYIADEEDSRLSSSEEWYPVNEFKMRSIVRAARAYLALQGGE